MKLFWAIGLTVVWVGVAQAAGPEVSSKEFQLYMDWMDGKDDERLAKLKDKDKRVKIAKNLGVSVSELNRAVDKVTPVAATLAKDSEKGVRDAADTTPLKGRLVEVHIDAGQGHVVAGVKWRCGDARDTDKEAAYVAWAVSDGAQPVKTLVLWCVNEGETKLFSAKVGRDGFEKITKDQVERFASSRYIKLFEEVKRGPHQ